MREEELSPELDRNIRDYCQDKFGAGDFADEVREELHDHFRDRVLGYLNREDELSEDDAFLLAREHFGDTAPVRGMLLNEHVSDAVPGLYRRMAAGVAVFVLVQPLAGLALAPLLNADTISPIDTGWLFTLWSILCTPLAYAPLRKWRTQMNRGTQPWFLRWPPLAIVVLLLVLYGGVGALQFYQADPAAPTPRYDTVAALLFGANFVVQAMLWFWWCRIPVRAPHLFLHAVLGLGLYGWPLYGIVMVSQAHLDSVARVNAFAESVVMLPYYFLQAGLMGLLFLGLRLLIPARPK